MSLPYSADYTTVQAVVTLMQKANPSTASAQVESSDDLANITAMIHQVSQYITDYTQRSFVPYSYTYNYYWQDNILTNSYNRNTLFLGQDLLVLNSITWNGTALSATDYRTTPTNSTPYQTITINPFSGLVPDLSDFSNGIVISGIWGYVPSISQAWQTVESIAGTLTSSATSITVASASAYEVLQYIRIDSEYMQVTARNTTTQVLTVTRGVLGTTATSHSNPYTIAKFIPHQGVQMVASRMVAWLLANRGGIAQTQWLDGSTTSGSMPNFVEQELKPLIRAYAQTV